MPDTVILLVAFSGGVVAALGQAAIPYFIGRAIDFASIDPEADKFRTEVLMLVAAAALCAVFTGIRGKCVSPQQTVLHTMFTAPLLTCTAMHLVQSFRAAVRPDGKPKVGFMSSQHMFWRPGGLFTVAMARLNARIRSRLFSALLTQEIGFFDKTKTGEITSRLSADTTTVADQVCLCVTLRGLSALPLHVMLLVGA